MTAYKVTAPGAVLGHEPGETFDADLSEAQERRLLESGALEQAGGSGRTEQRSPLHDKSDEELLTIARDTAGVPEPEKLPNREAVIDAIEAAKKKGV